ncbi:actin cortical patch SUR7/pH-response regulator pali [Sporodiniella umbellata]|nr:actin cortical patch SUR7/pH-response regulator pali [Sporodiniella umbellata]
MAFFGHLASFFTFAALVLQVFTLLGNTYNRAFLHSLYLARLSIGSQFTTFGLWSFCSGSGTSVSTCSHPIPAFDWSQADGVKNLIGDMHNYEKLFLANFILYWIALGLTLIALVITIMSHFRRGPDFCAAIATFFAFVVMLVVFVIVLIISIRGVNMAKGASNSVSGSLGPATWMTLGAFVALLFSSISYCFACICGPGRIRSEEKA